MQRFVQAVQVFKALNERQVGDCVAKVKQLAAELRAEDFDFEAATNLLAVLSRLRTTEIQLEDAHPGQVPPGTRAVVRFMLAPADNVGEQEQPEDAQAGL